MIANPENSLGGGCLRAESGVWYVVRTKSRQEKSLAQTLTAQGINHFLPLIEQVRYHGRRKARVREPLFKGYLFLRGELEDLYAADRTKRVAGIIHVNNQTQLDEELHAIELALNGGARLNPLPRLVKGVRVEVRSGPFRGMRGVIEDRNKRDRLILQVETTGNAASLEIDGSLVEVVA